LQFWSQTILIASKKRWFNAHILNLIASKKRWFNAHILNIRENITFVTESSPF